MTESKDAVGDSSSQEQKQDKERKKKRRKKKDVRKVRIVASNLLSPWPEMETSRQPANNRLKTTKYTAVSFLPKNLFEQFHRFANVYFVFIALLNFVPAVNAFQPELALAPVLFILAVTAVKDLWEDYSRYRSDQEINHMECLVYCRVPAISYLDGSLSVILSVHHRFWILHSPFTFFTFTRLLENYVVLLY